MTPIRPALAVAAVLALTACQQGTVTTIATPGEPPVVVTNPPAVPEPAAGAEGNADIEEDVMAPAAPPA